MPSRIMLLALGAALGVAAPALAQETAPAAPSDEAAGSSAAIPAGADVVTVRNISRVELSPGLQIVDDKGQPIGTVKKVAGNTIIVTDGSADYGVPIEQLYAYHDGAADHFASRLPKSALPVEQEGG